MNLVIFAFLAIMTGLVAAGFVWYGWGLIENLLVLRARRRQSLEADRENQTEEAE